MLSPFMDSFTGSAMWQIAHDTDTQSKADFTVVCLPTLSSCLLEWKYSHSSVSSTISSHRNTKACSGTCTAEKEVSVRGKHLLKNFIVF